MRLGISSWAFQWLAGRPNHPPEAPLTPIGLLDKADELDIGVVQIADNLPLHTYSDEVIDTFGEEANRRNITVELGTHGIDVDNLLRYLDSVSKSVEIQMSRFGLRTRATVASKPESE